MIFDGGKQVALAELSKSGVRASQISYARTNWAGEVDLIVLNNSQSDNEIYGRAIVEFKRDPETGEKSDQTIAIEYGNGKDNEGYQQRQCSQHRHLCGGAG